MPLTTFAELPATVQQAVRERTGDVAGYEAAPVGNHAELAGTLHTEHGRVFVKGTRLLPDQHWGGPEAWSLRNEAAVNPHVQPWAPRLLWQVETGGWLLTGFEHVSARHAHYAPGSPDLDALAEVIDALAALQRPDPKTVRLRVEQRYIALDERAAALAGDGLLHCDLNPANVLITQHGRARVVDWAFAARGATWLECGFLIPWLLRDGHTPAAAESWLTRFPAWKTADPQHIDLFARLLARQWARRNVAGADKWISEYTSMVARWTEHRGTSS